MNDRLGDLPGWANESDDGDDNNRHGDVEMADKQPKHMEHFFREVETIKEDIEAVKRGTLKIASINEQALQATTTEEENELSNRLRPLVDDTNKRAKRTKNMLGLLKEENKKLKDEGKAKGSDLRCVFFVGKKLCCCCAFDVLSFVLIWSASSLVLVASIVPNTKQNKQTECGKICVTR
jgi:Syntaxin